jgi:GTPase involved in cell partitioning and DNA repair
LRKELNKYSETLYKRKFAIVLTKVDTIVSEDEKNEKISKIFKALNIEATNSNKFKFKDMKYIQITDEFSKLDVEKPLFISTLSAVTGFNIESIKYALYELIKLEK